MKGNISTPNKARASKDEVGSKGSNTRFCHSKGIYVFSLSIPSIRNISLPTLSSKVNLPKEI